MIYIVMGREFYSSWPVRVFSDEGDAKEFVRAITERYKNLCVPTLEDREKSQEFGVDVDGIAEDRAQQSLGDWDPKAAGLGLEWVVVSVPLNDESLNQPDPV